MHENPVGISERSLQYQRGGQTQMSLLQPLGALGVHTLLPFPGARASVAPGVSLLPLTDAGLSALCSQDFSSCPQRNPRSSLGVQLPTTAAGQAPRVASWT